MVIYIDVLFLNNTVMTLAIIWAVGHLLNYESKWWRLIFAALIGTIYTLIIIWLDFTYFKILWQIGLNIITAITMVYIAFGKLTKKKFWKAFGYLYLVSFMTIGTTLSIFYIYGVTPFQRGKNLPFIISGLIVLFIIGKYGWRVFQRYITPDIFYVPVTIIINSHTREITGLIDTGNKLNDPLTQNPVIIIELREILPMFSKTLSQQIKNCKGGIMEYFKIFNDHNWSKRVRVLPFSDLGQEHGMLLGLRPDKVIVTYKGNQIVTERVVLGLTFHELDDEGQYQALVHSRILC